MRTNWKTLSGTALIAVAATVLVPVSAEAGPPVNAHCGTEPSNNNNAFVDHAQLTNSLKRIERTTGGEVDVDVVGQSNQGRDIYSARVGHGGTVIYVQTQIHGNENHGTEAVLNLLTTLGGKSAEARTLRSEVTLVTIPRLNVDGGEEDTRQNQMSWADVVADFPQLAGATPAWNYNSSVPGFDVNRDFHPDLDYVPQPQDFPGNSADTGWYVTPEAQTSRNVFRGLEQEFGTVDYFVDLHNQWSCYEAVGTGQHSSLSISGKFIDDPSQFGDWPKFDLDASRRANVAVYDALQTKGASGYGAVTLYPQDTNLPGTALGSFGLRGSATVLFETSSQTQYDGSHSNGYLTKQVQVGLRGLVDAVADGSIAGVDPNAYDKIPTRKYLPAD